MTTIEPLMQRPIKELPRSFRAKRPGSDQTNLYARSSAHSRTHSRDTGSRTTEGDSASLPTTSDPGSTNSTSAPSTPPQIAADALPAKAADAQTVTATETAQDDGKTFRFTNLPRLPRPDLLMDPLAAARVVLNYSAQAQQALSMHSDGSFANPAMFNAKDANTLANNMANVGATFAAAVNADNSAAAQPALNGLPAPGVKAPSGGQTAFSVARMQLQQEEDECGPELTVYEHSVNKKKRKSGRVTYLDSSGGGTDGYRSNGKGDCSWYCGNDADYPPDEDPNRDYANGGQSGNGQEREAPPPIPRMVHPPPHLSFSARQLVRVRAKVSSRSRFQRFERRSKAALASFENSQANANGHANGEAGKDGKPDPALEKKPPRRATKAESRAKVRGGGAPKISLAALKAKLAEEQAGSQGGDAASGGHKNGTSKAAGPKSLDKRNQTPEQPPPTEKTAPALPDPPAPPKVRPPVCAFTFVRSSPIASRLVAMRAEVEMLQSKLSDSLRPIDEAVAAAADVLTRLDAGEDVAQAHAEAAAALTAARSNLEAIPAPSAATAALVNAATRTIRKALPAPPAPAAPQPYALPPTPPVAPELPSAPPQQAQPATPTPVAPVATTTPPTPSTATGPDAPPASTVPPPNPPKMSRRKKANMNNIHHRTNYVPSRMPSDPPPSARGPTKNVSQVTNWEQPPGLDHPTTTCSLFANEWICLFCEYELLYGEPPSMLRACRRRKKLVGARKRAQDRAHRVAGGETGDGTGTGTGDGADGDVAGAGSGDKKKKKGKKKAGGGKNEHGHECCTCTCGKEDPAEWEPNAPFIAQNGAAQTAAAPPSTAALPPSPVATTTTTPAGDAGLPLLPEHDPENCETCRMAAAEELAADQRAAMEAGGGNGGERVIANGAA